MHWGDADQEAQGLLIEGVVIYPELADPKVGGAPPVRDGAVWIEGGRIRAIGPLDVVRQVAGRGVARLDGQGALALPGLVDSHFHLGAWALGRLQADLGACRTLAEVVERLRRHAAGIPPGWWVVGRGLALYRLESGPRFDMGWLDRAFPDRPVLIWTKDMHSVLLNRAARMAAGIGPEFTGWPPGAVVERDPLTGDWTGVFREAAISVIEQAIPRPSVRELAQAIDAGQGELFRLGLVGVHAPEGPEVLGALSTLHQRGRLKLKVRFMPPAAMLDTLRSLGLRQGFGDERLRLGPVKAFADGSLGSLTAALIDPYTQVPDPEYRGELLMDRDAVLELAVRAAEAGFAVAVHAIGDRACREVLDGLEAALGRGASVDGFPHRIEHVQLITRQDARRLGRLGVVASMQPVHLLADRTPAERYWQGRTGGAYATRWLLDGGCVLAFGSDAPVEDPDPLLGIYAAVTRRPLEEPAGSDPGSREGGPWHPEHALSVMEAIGAYTRGAAFAVGEQGQRGSLRPGMVGDVVLVTPDIVALDEALRAEGRSGSEGEPAVQASSTLRQARVLATVVDGRVVFSA